MKQKDYKKLKILFLTYEIIDRGGSFVRCFSLAKELVKKGHEVTILCSSAKASWSWKDEQREGVKIIQVPCPLPDSIRHAGVSPFQVFFRLIHVHSHNYDLVHGFGHRPAVFFPSIYFKYRHRKTYFADWSDLWGPGGIANQKQTWKGRLVGKLDGEIEKKVYVSADYVTVISSYLKKKILSLGKKSDQVFLVQVGSPNKTIIPLEKKAMRKKNNIPEKANILVYAGSAPYDLEFLARVLIKVNKTQPATLLFIGDISSSFARIISESNHQHLVIHRKFLPHHLLSELLACGDIMLLPFLDKEINKARFPNKLGDYLSAGRPIVTNKTGELKQIFKDNLIGLASTDSEEAYSQNIIDLINNPKLRNQMAKNARRLAEDKLSWTAIAEDLEAAYQKVI